MNRTIPFLVLFTATLAFADAPAIKLTSTTRPIGNVTADSVKFGTTVSTDQRHTALFVMDGQRVKAIHDGKPEPTFDWIVPRSAMFTDDGKSLLYIAQNAGEMSIVLNGLPQKGYYEVLPPYGMGPHGDHLAYVARQKDGKQLVVFDGKEGPAFDKIQFFATSHDAAQVAYAGERDGAAHFYQNGAEVPLADHVTQVGFIRYSPDDKHFACSYMADKHWFVKIDDKTYGPFDAVEFGSPFYSKDSAHWTICAQTAKHVQLLKDGPVIDTADLIGNATFSPDSQHLSYIALKDRVSSVVRDGQPYATCANGDKLSAFLSYSPDSKRLMYILNHPEDGGQCVVVDGKEQLAWLRISNAIFNPTSDNVAYVAYKTKDEARVLTQDGFLSDAVYADIASGSLTFSPDGKHVAYVAGNANKTITLFIDGVPGPSFQTLLAGTNIVFDDNATLRFVAGEKGFLVNEYTVQITP